MNLYSSRLCLRPLQQTDAAFIIRLTHDKDWLRFIGDRGINTQQDALEYINNARESLATHYIGPMAVTLEEEGAPIGLCGLFQRPFLQYPDLGFAFLPQGRGKGYALEASERVMAWAVEKGISPVIGAVSDAENMASRQLLDKLDFESVGQLYWSGIEKPQRLYLKRVAYTLEQ